MRKFFLGLATAGLISGMAGAEEFSQGPAGEVFDRTDSVVVGAGTPVAVRRWIPLTLAATSSQFNNSVVGIVDGDILGGTSSFSSTGNPNLVWYFATADQLDANGGFTSNNVQIDEFPDSVSDTCGAILPDGRLVYRANFGIGQNNLEFVDGDVFSQLPVFQEPSSGTGILTGPGIDGAAGSAFLSVPSAHPNGTGFWTGNTNFDAFTGDVPRGLNIWDYQGAALSVSSPSFTYLQADAETFANANGVIIAAGDGRQTQPVFATVNGVNYVAQGIGDTALGGSARPLLLAVDAFEDGNSFTDAVAILPPAGFRFIDHQSTGGGTNVFENSHFDMNSSGQIVAVLENTASVPSYQVRLYEPTIDAGTGRITGYDSGTILADAGPLGTGSHFGGPIVITDPVTGDILDIIGSFSGVGINELGSVAFSAIYNTGDTTPEGDPITNSAMYMITPDGTTHQLAREDDEITFNAQTVKLGLLPQEGSDSFFAPGLAESANVVALDFRLTDDVNFTPYRGVLVISVGDLGDTNFDGAIDATDCDAYDAALGATFGTAGYDPELDTNGDGVIDAADVPDECTGCPNDPAGTACDTDVTGDCIVNNQDLGVLLAAYLTSVGDPSYNPDVNFDNTGASQDRIDNVDLGELLADYLNNCN